VITTGLDLNKKAALNFFDNLIKIRIVEKKIANEYQKNIIRCPVHLSIGQEGVATAVSFALDKKDYFISNHRSHAHYLAKNGSIFKMFCEILGKKNGCSKGHGGSMHLIDLDKNFLRSTAIVSSSIPVGIGYAEGLKIQKKKQKICIFIGDASVEEGVFYEAANYAVLKNLPVVFLCENNNYSVYTHIDKRQPRSRKIYNIAKSIGLNSLHINEKCPYKIYDKLKKFLKKKNYPIFIEIPTWRYLEHCGPNEDDNLNYRSSKDVIFWKKNDPIILAEKYLKSKYRINNELISSRHKFFESEVSSLFNKALKSK